VSNPVTRPTTRNSRQSYASPTSGTGPQETTSASAPESEQVDVPSYPEPMMFPYAPVIGMGLQQVQMWHAPFPPPQAVRDYEHVLPGSWDRLLTMAEESQAAQISTMREAQKCCSHDTRRGHWLGVAALFGAMGGALYSVATRQPWAAAAFLSIPVMAVARSFTQTTRDLTRMDDSASNGRSREKG